MNLKLAWRVYRSTSRQNKTSKPFFGKIFKVFIRFYPAESKIKIIPIVPKKNYFCCRLYSVSKELKKVSFPVVHQLSSSEHGLLLGWNEKCLRPYLVKFLHKEPYLFAGIRARWWRVATHAGPPFVLLNLLQPIWRAVVWKKLYEPLKSKPLMKFVLR